MGKTAKSEKQRLMVEIESSIVSGYTPSEGCPPLQDHDLARNLYVGSDWLKRFAQEIVGNDQLAIAWSELRTVSDESILIELLYLFTSRKTLAQRDQEAHALLSRELEKVGATYGEVSEKISRIRNNPELRPSLGYLAGWFHEELQRIEAAQELIGRKSEMYRSLSSPRSDPRDWYLCLLAGRMQIATGSYRLDILLELIRAAAAAHGDRKARLYQHAMLKKRLQRYTKRFRKIRSPELKGNKDKSLNDLIPF